MHVVVATLEVGTGELLGLERQQKGREGGRKEKPLNEVKLAKQSLSSLPEELLVLCTALQYQRNQEMGHKTYLHEGGNAP